MLLSCLLKLIRHPYCYIWKHSLTGPFAYCRKCDSALRSWRGFALGEKFRFNNLRKK